MTDNTKYIFKNNEYGKGRLVLAVIKQYMQDVNLSYEQLKQQFPDSLQGSQFVVISADDLLIRSENSNDNRVRYFEGAVDEIKTSEGTTVYVSNQWGAGNINSFISRAEAIGYEIKKVRGTSQMVDKNLTIKLTDGAIRNGYIRILDYEKLFENDFVAEDERDETVSKFKLIADDGTEFDTYIIKNKKRLKQRFYSYFKNRNIRPGTVVHLSEIERGKYKMEFKSDTKSIKELYEEYKESPFLKWIGRYEDICSKVDIFRDDETLQLGEPFLKGLWLKPDNGIANTSPRMMTNIEYEKLKSDLPIITEKIIKDPSLRSYNETYEWAKNALKSGKFVNLKKAVINRVFSAINPRDFSSIISRSRVVELIEKLNDNFQLDINSKGNWAELNINLMQAIRSQGLEDEGTFMVNTFVWHLYESLVGEDSKSDEELNDDITTMKTKSSCKNIIYYGPPGTGKTYQLQGLLKTQYTESGVIPDEHLWLTTHIEQLSWHEVIILILLESDLPMKVADIIRHEYFQIKAELNDRKTNLRATAWSSLQSHAIANSSTVNSSRRIEPLVFDKTEESLWFIVDSEKEQLEEISTLYNQLKTGPENADIIKRYEFVTFHQSYGYEEFIEGLRPETDDEGNISYDVKPGVFKRICKRAQADPENKYAMVIDEINRGNISKIFGELITLVEVDKRAGCDNELSLTLPYSGTTFSVPSNLDIIGTMNTADRSLTHIDVALRRRFDFKELRTDYSLIPENVDGINLKWMLYAMNQRIELLLDREHILGHALLMHARSLAEIEHVFKTNIMPLLEEYFFENWDKINRVLNKNGFVEEQKNAYDTWLGNGDDYASKSYRINQKLMQSADAYQTIYSAVDPSVFSQLN